MASILTRAAAAPVAAALAAAALVGLHPDPARAADPFGTWLTEDGRARVRTERCGSDRTRLCGYVVWGSQPLDETGKPKVDRYNPDPGKRGRLLLGHQMLMGLKPDDGRYAGTIYNGDNGKSYDVTVWSDAPAVLSVKGCILFFCGTQGWKRVADAAPGQLQGATDAAGGPRSDPEWAAKPASAAPAGTPAKKAAPPK